MIGQKLNNRYTITSRLGKGAMGTVYRATDMQTAQEVALKVISSELAVEPEMLERFKREGETLRQLKHPNIVGFIDAFQHEDHYVIIMEYISSGSLHDLIKQGPMPVEQARQIALDLCDALIRAHRLNIIHRDIKPENILIDQDGIPKLADFGVARLNEGTRMTRSGTQVGTPYYMAPEAWEGKDLDAQADIWSLGVLLFEMLTGQVPFTGETGPTVMNKVFTTQPPDLKKLRADIPLNLTQIIKRMLTRDRKRRYPTMREVAVDLERGQRVATAVPAKVKSTHWLPALIGFGVVLAISAILLVTQSQRTQSAAQVAESISSPTKTPHFTSTPKPSATPIPSATSILPGAILFSEDFEHGEPQGFSSISGDWKLIDDGSGNMVYEESDDYSGYHALEFGSDTWTDYEIEYRVRMLNAKGHTWLNFRKSEDTDGFPVGNYVEYLNSQNQTVSLQLSLIGKGWQQLKSRGYNVVQGVWYDIRVEAQGENLRIYINGDLQNETTDSRFLAGGLTLEGAYVQVDDIRVTALGEAAAATEAQTLGIGSTLIGADGAMLMYVPEGRFMMGSDSGSNDEQPINQVNLNAFWIDQTEVTNAMYAKCVDAGICKEPTSASSYTHSSYYGNSEFDNYPVIYIDWNMANAYCAYAERRLPTEAEWEKAARNTDRRTYPWGNEAPNSALLNYNSEIGDTTEVGKYPEGASVYGALDMSGNVWEWVSSLYFSYPYNAGDGREKLGSSESRVRRGGSWSGYQNNVRSAYREAGGDSEVNVGFRCARSP